MFILQFHFLLIFLCSAICSAPLPFLLKTGTQSDEFSCHLITTSNYADPFLIYFLSSVLPPNVHSTL